MTIAICTRCTWSSFKRSSIFFVSGTKVGSYMISFIEMSFLFETIAEKTSFTLRTPVMLSI